jgi:galactokinase
VDDAAALALADRLAARAPGAPPPLHAVALAPGRVNLIGEHVDYNEGWVLPLTIDRHVAVALAPRDDDRLVVHAEALGTTFEIALDGLPPPDAAPAPRPVPGPAAYVAGVAWELRAAGIPVRGAELLIDADLPRGAGLASSAALELAVARALAHAAGAPWDAGAMAAVCVRAEQRWAGVPCGPMDQLAAACGRPDAALLIDCRSLAFEAVPLPAEAAFVVLDSGVRRTLAAGAYAERRASCVRALAALAELQPGLTALRDADLGLLHAAGHALDDTTFRRALHVLRELPRPAQLAEALNVGDLVLAGALLDDSHRSLAELYEVSGPELDALCARARAEPGCHGARLTGAGFGGCALALVERTALPRFLRAFAAHAAFEARPAAGARLVTA